eukprot:TRINITY_DN26718_c0_g1_i1.p1 TRINITY_DN26718_c0_g1~~TRINITY_DN26718_c0_g1_i1.p1  ORF type:complete len:345 (+),score=69.44 TRINITY_DN26718_c0_g1_i1:55-1089(+)
MWPVPTHPRSNSRYGALTAALAPSPAVFNGNHPSGFERRSGGGCASGNAWIGTVQSGPSRPGKRSPLPLVRPSSPVDAKTSENVWSQGLPSNKRRRRGVAATEEPSDTPTHLQSRKVTSAMPSSGANPLTTPTPRHQKRNGRHEEKIASAKKFIGNWSKDAPAVDSIDGGFGRGSTSLVSSLADDTRAKARSALKHVLDKELDIFCMPALHEVDCMVKDALGCDGTGAAPGTITGIDGGVSRELSRAELVTQLSGLAGVRSFVDEQLASDLGERTRACRGLLQACLQNASSGNCGGGGNRVASDKSGIVVSVGPQKRAEPLTAEPTKLALAPFRSCSRGAPRRR